MRRGPIQDDRGFVLIAVLVIVGSALLVTTSMLFTSTAEFAAARVPAEHAQARALAWSGLQAVMSRLNDQRRRILDGEPLELDDQYVIYEAGARLGVVRLLPCGPGGALLVAEGAKVDVNSADATALMATGMMDAALVDAIVSFRDTQLGRPLQSIAELLLVEGMTPALLLGESDAAAAALVDDSTSTQDARPRCLADVLTVHACEPALQRSGAARINLNVPWSDELARAVDARFGAGESALLKQVFESGTKFDSEARIFEVMRTFKVETRAWPEILDTFTTDSAQLHFGRLDINLAPREALLALAGLTSEQADRVVERRQSLMPAEKATIAWPALQGIVPPESYDALAGKITTRSWAYRIRLAAGEVAADDDRGELAAPMIYEAVIDLAAPRPRVAYLRDITMLKTVMALARGETARTDEHEGEIGAVFGDDELGADSDSGAAAAEDGTSDATMPKFSMPLLDVMGGWGEGSSAATTMDQGDEPSASGDAATPTSSSGRRIGRWRSGG